MKRILNLFILFFMGSLFNPIHSQNDIASSSLRYHLNTKREKVKNDVPADQSKSALKMGTVVCMMVDGTPTRAMVTGKGLRYGSKRDSYNVQITAGPKSGQTVFPKPDGIASVGECSEEYFPRPNGTLPDNLDIRKLELEIIKEVNLVRANPRAYADEMAKLKFETFGRQEDAYDVVAIGNDPMWNSSPDDSQDKQGYMKKLQVAIDYLRAIDKPLTTLAENLKLAKACEMLAADKGKIDGPGHKDSQGRTVWQRAEAAGYTGTRGECLNANHNTAAGFVVSFLTSPGHRDILMKTDINEIGVDLALHNPGSDAWLRDVIIVGFGDQIPVVPPPTTPPTTTEPTAPTTPTTTEPTAPTTPTTTTDPVPATNGVQVCTGKVTGLNRPGDPKFQTLKVGNGDNIVSTTVAGAPSFMMTQPDQAQAFMTYSPANSTWGEAIQKLGYKNLMPISNMDGVKTGDQYSVSYEAGKLTWNFTRENNQVAAFSCEYTPSNMGTTTTTAPNLDKNALASGMALKEGERIYSPNKSHYLIMQSDGNCVIYSDKDRFVWGTMTTTGNGCQLKMQSDGNLVLYDRADKAIWSSETHPYWDKKYETNEWKPTNCALENDGTLSLFSATNKKVWNSKAGKL